MTVPMVPEMVRVSGDACMQCGLCVSVCHAHCLFLGPDGVRVDRRLCTTCGQCVAVCPTGAVTWNGVPSRWIRGDKLPGYENLVELLKARRTTRHFKRRRVDRETLERLCATARLAPTNSFDLETVVVDTPAAVGELEDLALRFVAKVYSRIYAIRPVFALFKLLSPAFNDTDKVKMERTLRERDLFHRAPAMILVVGDPRVYYAELSAQYAMYNMVLTAQTLGLGTCISGAGKTILARSGEARRILGIPKGKQILGVLLVGYPAVRFTRAVEGKEPRVRWA